MDLETMIERPRKKEEWLEKLMEKLLENPELDKSDIFYSRRCRKQVWDIVEWMMCHDYVPDNTNDELREFISVLANSQKRLSAFEKEHSISWHSICYPLDPKYISHDKPHLVYEYGTLLKQLQIVFGRLIYGMPRCKASSNDIKESDVVSLLGQTLVARTGERVVFESNTFRGKYVLVWCINAPVLFQSNAFQSLLNLCNELSSERADIEIVMVVRMNILADTKDVFDHLFSGYPSSCLAVPFEEWERRESIWKLLSCGFNDLQCCVVYNTNGLFLNSFYVDPNKGFPYGAEVFPFSEEMVQKVQNKCLQLRKDNLENLLRPYESSPDVIVYEFNSSKKERPRCISEVIKNKHVGLYICCKGNLIPLLCHLYEHCKLNHQEFEIVVLYLPFLSAIYPDIFIEKIDGLLQENNIYGWWCLPFNNSVSLRFWGLTMDYDIGDMHLREDLEDKLIIVGPDGKILDMYGAQVIKRVDGIDTYPFTRAAVVQKKMREVRDVKLESLLEGRLFRGDDPNDVISAYTLLSMKKKIIVYMGRLNEYIVNGMRYDFHGLVSQYKETRKSADEFEVVFIEYPDRKRGVVNAWEFGAMPWYINNPLDGTYTSLAKRLTKLVQVQSLIGFGEDGRICSVKLLEELHKSNNAGLCSEETLFDDLYQYFQFDEYKVI